MNALACCPVPDILPINFLSVLSKTVRRSQPEQRTVTYIVIHQSSESGEGRNRGPGRWLT